MIPAVLCLILLLQTTNVPPGVLAGQLSALGGSPAIAIRVSAIPAPTAPIGVSDGQEYYRTQPPVSSALTDNQGRYRLVNIPPGRYFIVAGPTYYPSTINPEAATVLTVTPDSTTQNLNFQLMTAFGGKISGRIRPAPGAGEQVKATLSGLNLDGVLQVPVGADGAFDFGHVAKGSYWIDLYPNYPGMGSFRVDVGDKDATGLELVRPPTRTLTGKIVVQNGPLPHAILAFTSAKSYVGMPINADGTFSGQLHLARHRVDLGGMPPGYSIASVRLGSQDVTEGFVVGNADVSGMVITVAAPRRLPRVHGQITGLANTRLSSTKVQMTGPIVGSLETAVRQDGSFEFAAATPGLYSLRLAQVPELAPIPVVVTWSDAEVQVAVPH
jgi:hypothetical protein